MKTPTGSEMLNCGHVEAEIALYAGGDLNDAVRQDELESHLAGCPSCRDYQLRMSQCLEVLQTCAAESTPVGRSAGVWPRVAAALTAYETQPVLARFNAWVPTTAIAAACAAMIFVTVIQVERGVRVMPGQDYFTDPGFAKSGAVWDVRTVHAPAFEGQNLPTTPVALDAKSPRKELPPPKLRFVPRHDF